MRPKCENDGTSMFPSGGVVYRCLQCGWVCWVLVLVGGDLGGDA